MHIGITGHIKIEKACKKKYSGDGSEYDTECFNKVFSEIENFLLEYFNNDLASHTFYSGMARGVDEIFGLIAIKHNAPLVLVLPNSLKWHKNLKAADGNMRAQAVQYDYILEYKNLKDILEIKKNYNGASFWCGNFARNQALLDNTDIMFSYKRYDSGGTIHCISLCKKQNHKLIEI